MNKRTAQSFALGILFSAIFLWAGSSVIADNEPKQQVTVANAKQLLEKKGYKVLNNSDFTKLSEKKAEVKEGTKEEAVKEEPKKEGIEEKPQAEDIAEETDKSEAKEEKNFTLVIAEGVTPGDVAANLKNQGIIEEEKKFERYLIDQGFHTKIQIGEYQLNGTMDYYQIAKIITKNR
ncbi:MAG TPA: hypothetical protein DCR24_03470 [Bacillus bacterium]|nr:hypothetical protein [Bacillus sp. (in: firmicutes)]